MKRLCLVSIFVLAIFALFITCGEDGGKGYTYTVTFDKNEGDTEADPQTKTVKSPATTVDALPTAPTRDHYNFTGWNTEADGNGTEFTAETPVTANITVYAQWTLALEEGTFAIKFEITGNVEGDSVAASPEIGKAGVSITINYTLAGGYVNNRLVFSGTETSIGEVDEAGTGTKTYIVDEEDADIDGTITITAAFTHTNKNIDTIAFEDNAINKTYGDAPFTETASAGSGSGAITYSSGHTDIATVNASTGEVTIVKVGSTTITATKEEDATYEGTTANYALHIAQLQLTIGAPTGTPAKTYDGNTTVTDVTGITAGSLTNKVGSDDVAATVASAAYDTADAGDSKTVTVTWSISGNDAGNYIKPVDSTITGTINKATGAAVSAPTKDTVTHSHITVNAVTAPANGQTVEYGIGTDNTSVPTTWQDGLTFSGRSEETDYYVWARAKASANYNAGTAAVSAKITTLAEPEPGATLTGTVTVYLLRHNSVRISTVAPPDNEQTVEYAVSTASTAPDSGWQNGRDFTGLTANTAYYAYARAKADDDYYAGTAISSASFTTKAAPTPAYGGTPPVVVNFESDITLNVTGGNGSATATRVADPDNSGEQSMQIIASGWNRGAIVPINLPYALQDYESFTFRFNLISGSGITNKISVYAKGDSSYASGGFGNAPDSTYTKFPELLVGEVTPTYSNTNQWVDYEITIGELNNAIKNLSGNIFLAIGINHENSVTLLFDDLTFNMKPYLNSTITPTTATYYKDENNDIPVAVAFNGNTLAIKNGGTTLTQGEHYTVADGVVTLLNSYFNPLAVGEITLTFDFSNGVDSEIVITIMASRPTAVTTITFTSGVEPNVDYIKTGSGNNIDVINASVTENNVLEVVKSNTNNSTPMVVFTFNLGNKTLSDFTSFYVDMTAISGDRGYKNIRVQVYNPDTSTYISLINDTQVNLGSSGQTVIQQSFNILAAAKTALGTKTGEIKIAFAVTNTTAITYQIKELRLNPNP